MEIEKILTQHVHIENINQLSSRNNLSSSKYYYVIGNFTGILEEKETYIELRYSTDKTILDLDLVDYIPFTNKGIEDLSCENYCIIYLCDFSYDEKDKVERVIKNRNLIISSVTREIRHVYLFRDTWSQSWSGEMKLKKEYGDVEFEEEQPEERFIMGHRSQGRLKKNSAELPLISIIMPTFNSEKTIEQSLQSVFYQNYPNYELLIVDGLSRDGTLDIVRKYEKYIDGVISEKDVNIFDAINKGTRLSRGDYSVFLGSDDLLMPNSLDLVAKSIQNGNKPDYFYGDGLRLKDNKQAFYTKTFIHLPKFDEYKIMHIALYITRKVFEDLNGFDINYDINADSDFKLKLINRNKVGVKIDKPLGVFRDGGYSSYAKGKVTSVFKVYHKHNAMNLKLYLFVIRYLLLRTIERIIGKGNYIKLMDRLKNH